MSEIWSAVHLERKALIEDLAGLHPEQWALPSACPGWTVHDVAAHLLDNARTTRAGFVASLLSARLDFDRVNARGVERERAADPAQTLARLREVAARTSGPPAPLASRLVEEIVHGEDIRRPLGLHRRYPPRAVARAVRLQARTPASVGGGKHVASQVRLLATDADLWVGEGPEVRGPAVSVLLVLTGRSQPREDLDGPGLALLADGS